MELHRSARRGRRCSARTTGQEEPAEEALRSTLLHRVVEEHVAALASDEYLAPSCARAGAATPPVAPVAPVVLVAPVALVAAAAATTAWTTRWAEDLLGVGIAFWPRSRRRPG